MSGLTTTGATLIDVPLETVEPSVHVWRAFTQWLGGMGVVVLTVAVLSRLAAAGARLMRAELPGGEVDRVRPGIIQTARSLWTVYACLSLALAAILFALVFEQTGSLYPAGLDVIVHTFTTMSTGRFSTRSISIQDFANPWIETTILVFMVLAGTNFAFPYRSLTRGDIGLFDDDGFKFFLGILAAGTVALVGAIFFGTHGWQFWTEHGGRSLITSLRLAAFQAVSIVTTIGDSTANFELWLELGCSLIVFFMFLGRLHRLDRRLDQGRARARPLPHAQGRAQTLRASPRGGPGPPGRRDDRLGKAPAGHRVRVRLRDPVPARDRGFAGAGTRQRARRGLSRGRVDRQHRARAEPVQPNRWVRQPLDAELDPARPAYVAGQARAVRRARRLLARDVPLGCRRPQPLPAAPAWPPRCPCPCR